MSEKGVRSYSGEVIGDSMSLTINFRFLLNTMAVFGTIIYGAYQFQSRIEDLERKMEEANNTITDLVEKHIIEEQQRFAEMEEELKWYEKNINPFSKKKKK